MAAEDLTPFIGNKPTQHLLTESLRRHTFHHAYIFAGKEGLGKKRLALQVAKSLNCLDQSAFPGCCDRCTSCRKIDARSHPDVQVIAPEPKVFKIDQIRALIQDIYYLPFEGRHRIFILEDAERMNDEAAHSLLKTLEEPPEKSMLILLTSNLYTLLPTIRSRAQILKFQPIPAREIQEHLVSVQGMPPIGAAKAARLSQGSLGLALSMDLEILDAMQKSAFTLLELMVHDDDCALLQHLGTLFSGAKTQEKNLDLFLQILISILRDLVIISLFQSREHLLYYDQIDLLRALKNQFHPGLVEQFLRDIEDFYRKRHLNLKVDIYFQNIVLRSRRQILESQKQ